jgi:uncharacterized membrane protein SpoIIM required for sporulation
MKMILSRRVFHRRRKKIERVNIFILDSFSVSVIAWSGLVWSLSIHSKEFILVAVNSKSLLYDTHQHHIRHQT